MGFEFWFVVVFGTFFTGAMVAAVGSSYQKR